MLPNPDNIVSRKSESVISSKIVINFYIVIWFGECSYLVLTIDHSFGTRFVFIMAALWILTQSFQSAIYQSAVDLYFTDSEVEAQMDEEQMEEEEEITIRGARWGGWRQWSYLSDGKDLIISIHPKAYLTLIASILQQTTLQTIPRSFWLAERGPSFATNATTQALDLAIWKKKYFGSKW